MYPLLPLIAQQVKNPLTKEEMQKTQVRSLGREDPLEEEIQLSPIFLPETSQGQKSLVGCSPKGCKESAKTEQLRTFVSTKTTREGDDREWDDGMASPTWWTWVWASSRSWWWTGKPDMLQSMGLQRVRTRLSNWTKLKTIVFIVRMRRVQHWYWYYFQCNHGEYLFTQIHRCKWKGLLRATGLDSLSSLQSILKEHKMIYHEIFNFVKKLKTTWVVEDLSVID